VGAISYGQPDGNRHPNVGGLVADDWFVEGQKDLLCSGTLIAPRVFLTASHCTSYLESLGIEDVWVTFAEQFDRTDAAALHHGVMYTHPDYPTGSGQSTDIAVVLLDQPVAGITPALLPTAGQFDRTNLLGQQFTNVGYGGQERVKDGKGGPAIEYRDAREFSTSTFQTLNKSFLKLSQNPTHGDGGTCFGDSGGPQFIGDTNTLASITITGDAACRSTNVVLRLDTQIARDFLDDFVVLP
jgi:V8-like Glu-specific endopeptidase